METGPWKDTADELLAQSSSDPDVLPRPRRSDPRTTVNTGNPRITVAFPFSTIQINQSDPGLLALAELVHQLAARTARMARDLDSDQAEALETLTGQVAAVLDQIADR